jgi:prevent-host-death family protein
MESIGVFDAKTRLSELLERAAKGEVIEITKHGHPVARLVPSATTQHDPGRVARAVARLKAFRCGQPKVDLQELLDARHDGHRF